MTTSSNNDKDDNFRSTQLSKKIIIESGKKCTMSGKDGQIDHLISE